MDVLGAMGIPSPSSLRGMGAMARERLARLGDDVEGQARDASPLRTAAAGTPSADWESDAADRYASTIGAWSERAAALESTLGEIAHELRLAGEEVESAVAGMASWLEDMEKKMIETAGRAAKNAGDVLAHEAAQGFRHEIEAAREQSVVWSLPSALGAGV